MAFVTLRFHYTLFRRQIQHVFEIFGTLCYKSTRSIRHMSHKSVSMKTFYRQNYEKVCQTEYFREMCRFGAHGAFWRSQNARSGGFAAAAAAVRLADCGTCAPREDALSPPIYSDKHYPTVCGVSPNIGGGRENRSRAPTKVKPLTRRAHPRRQRFFGALRGFLNPRFLPYLDKRRKSMLCFFNRAARGFAARRPTNQNGSALKCKAVRFF